MFCVKETAIVCIGLVVAGPAAAQDGRWRGLVKPGQEVKVLAGDSTVCRGYLSDVVADTLFVGGPATSCRIAGDDVRAVYVRKREWVVGAVLGAVLGGVLMGWFVADFESHAESKTGKDYGDHAAVAAVSGAIAGALSGLFWAGVFPRWELKFQREF